MIGRSNLKSKKWILFLVVLGTAYLNSLLVPVAVLAESSPSVLLDSKSSYLMIWLNRWIPEIKFYANADLKGHPSFLLDAEGLHQRDTLLCSWPGGRFNLAKSYNMVLGYRDIERGKYEGCGEGSPLLSTWGDGGKGTAMIYIRVEDKRGLLITTDHKDKQYFFDLDTIPENNWEWLEVGDEFRAVED